MREFIIRSLHVTSPHPAPELLVPYALGAKDATTARHVAGCAICRTEIEEMQQAAGLLRGSVLLERRVETPECPDEFVLADFVDGRLSPEARAPVVAHLLTCARCRGVVTATSGFAADAAALSRGAGRRWRRWSLPLGLAAAAALVVLLLPRGADDGSSPGLREPTDTSVVAPLPIAPRGAVPRVDRLVWSSVPRVERYRLRLYTGDGDVLWTKETTDTSVTLPNSVVLSPQVTYFWKVEAQTEWKRWVASDLVEFRLGGPSR